MAQQNAADLRPLVAAMLRDIGVELGEEFDRNFERQSFFSSSPWARRKGPDTGRALLTRSGSLRRSLRRPQVTGGSVTFSSALPYAALHNEGGDLKVTRRMKLYFWARCYEAQGGMGRKKDGTLRRDRKNRRLGTEAEFWRALALKRVGSTIHIPRRQFLGPAPEVERAVCRIIDENLEEFFRKYDL